MMYGVSCKKRPGLAKITEEAGELLEVLGKIQASEGEFTYPWPEEDGTHRNLKQEAEDECADVIAAVTFFAERNGLNQNAMIERAERKIALYYEWRLDGSG